MTLLCVAHSFPAFPIPQKPKEKRRKSLGFDVNYLQIKNWERFQHYKNKDNPPPWIKLYADLLLNYEFLKLSEADRYKLIGVWLLASKSGGKIPRDNAHVARCIGVKRIDLVSFISSGWLEPVYSYSRQPLALADTAADKELRAEQKGSVEHSLVKLLTVLHDADSQTEKVIRSFNPTEGDLEAAREAALGPGVKSRTKVAVAEIKKRREAA